MKTLKKLLALLAFIPALCGAAQLTTALTSSATTISLTGLAADNWKEWEGESPSPGVETLVATNAKSGGTGTIGIAYYNSAFSYTTAVNRTMSWTDGAPTASGTSTNALSNEGGFNQGFTLTFDADTTTREARIYFGGFDASTNVDCALSDSSATATSDTLTGTSNAQASGYLVITYSAASAAQTLSCNVYLSNNLGGSGGGRYVWLQAASVKASGGGGGGSGRKNFSIIRIGGGS